MLTKTIAFGFMLMNSSLCAAWGIMNRDKLTTGSVTFPHAATSTPINGVAMSDSNLDVALNSIEVLLSKRKGSEIFSTALAQVQSLKKSNSCHRTAARVFLDSCQYLEEFAVSDVSEPPDNNLMHIMDYMYGYALSLSMCDLGAARQRAPASCQHFHESVLQTLPTRAGAHSLHVSHQQVHNCMEDLYSDINFWTSFTNNKAKATLFCQLARLDIEQDLAIVRLEQALNAVAKVMDNLETQLERSKLEFARQRDTTRSYFGSLNKMFGILKEDVMNTVNATRSGLVDFTKDVRDSFQNFGEQLDDCKQALGSFSRMILMTHAEHASAHAQVVEEATDLAVNIRKSNTEVRDFNVNVDILSTNFAALANSLEILQQRQDLMDTQSSYALRLMENITEQLHAITQLGENHTLVLAQARKMANGLLVEIDQVRSTASVLDNTLGISWSMLLGFPCTAVVLGSYGLKPSMMRNISLMLSGFMVSTALTYGPVLLASLGGLYLAATKFPTPQMDVVQNS
ncbi:MAG: hypothetical protein M1818_006075 [Claussenomyces sp. TS43310]|nr:MAG: hypothetical protein M1818_006075 [Claussenomyces sp. TS43310]